MTRQVSYIAFGANLGDRAATIQEAIARIDALPSTIVEQQSPLYVTAPVGYDNQPDFLNGVVRVTTEQSPHELLGHLLRIESELGRERPFANAPRTIDLDLLLYDKIHLQTESLTLPHPRMWERAFVLVPLADVIRPNSPWYDKVMELRRKQREAIRRWTL